MKRIPITTKIRQELNRAQAKAQRGIIASILSRPDCPEGLNAGLIKGWTNGKIKSARVDHLHFTMDLLRNPERPLPEGLDGTAREAKDESSVFVAVTEDHRDEIRYHRKRVGLAYSEMLERMNGGPPTPSHSTVRSWLSGRRISAKRKTFEAFLQTIRALPDNAESTRTRKRHATPEGRVRLTPAILKKIEDEKERTGIASTLLLRYADNVPDGFSSSLLDYWMRGKIKSASQDHIDFVLAAYAAMPTEVTQDRPTRRETRITLTEAHRAKLKKMKEETGIGPMRLLRQREDVPAGLNSAIIQRWISGGTETAKPEHLEYVLSTWQQASPDIVLSETHIERLLSESARTGVGWTSLLAHMKDKPRQLRANTLSRWTSGRNETVRREIWTAVMDTFASLPDANITIDNSGRAPPPLRKPFTAEDRDALIRERDRTGVYQRELLRTVKKDQPTDINAGKISTWINNPPETVPLHLFEWTLQAWLSLPDR
ncbi:hypothetical protein FF098_015895 [Parvularcula flava]|uniref:Uncharacterized protein n=1 Tax=Aquisalinus luteolus TaxID=1566827 RepID=A0A8J3A4E2_9PROT|nr:hypothetical protein [Aquisalinus luteolus]NHK29398.1 hypothetical protein [Aquisalinus luteolus]GGI02070.1 hypothetical protein GCM10011355_34210 [Aquisalinus luteolus]